MRAWFIVFVMACGEPEATTPATESVNAACAPAYDIRWSPGTRFEDVDPTATAPWPVSGVSFSARAVQLADAVRVEGVLENTTDAEVHVDLLSGGVMGISTNPFQVDVEGETPVATGPEIYPGPRRAVLPAHGTVTYEVTRCPRFPAHVRWTFSPWSGPAVQGEASFP